MAENRVFFIADDTADFNLVKEALASSGYNLDFLKTTDLKSQLDRNISFDVLILDLNNNCKEANSILKEIRAKSPDSVVISIIDSTTATKKSEPADLEVFDYIDKPIVAQRLVFAVKKSFEFRRLLLNQGKLIKDLKDCNLKLDAENNLLERRLVENSANLRELYKSLQDTYMHTIRALAQAIEAKDHYTFSHSDNVSKVAMAVARQMHLSDKEIEEIDEACQLHDLGKIGIHDSVLNKKTPLTPGEWQEIKTHALKGAQILQPLTFLGRVIDLVKQHHEQYDGSGYPTGLNNGDILIGARILALADAYEAMVSKRPYRERPMTKQEAIKEIQSKSGSQFDPDVVGAFLKVVDKI
ncbi:MAG: HD domain-containing phosphohydrolase [Candidatus Omnitrophota bacterium]